ncbi:MAG: HAMP domain-containing histidine kinase [Cyanobacteria bacterium]|nr:HAMP domain-containing histidine kinase [Cyanobacteriota bacterium]
MNIRHQILLLLCLPIICQLATVGLLYSSLTTVDQSARQEIQAKLVIAQLQECDGLLGRTLVKLTDIQFFNKRKDANQDAYLKTVEEKNATLVRLVQDNADASRIAKSYRSNAKKLVENWIDLTNSHTQGNDKLFFSQFLSTAEYLENMKVLSDQLYKGTQDLLAIYRPMVVAMQPRALEGRMQLRTLIIVAVALNIVIIAVLAIIINKQTIMRMNSLLNHIRAFAKGGMTSTSLEGRDELAEVDQTFTAVANERHKLDLLRQSIREMVNHDLRSPLTSMCLRIESLLELYGDGLLPPVKVHLNQLNSETNRLSRLANTLLDVDRIEDGKLDVELKPTKLALLASNAQSILQSQSERRKININLSLEEDLFVLCDNDRTIQVLTNLLSNAVKFAPKDSTIEMIGRKLDADFVRIEVVDEGRGVPPDEIANLFKRFSQLDQPDEIKKTGSGLGLYICKSLIEAQEGRIGYSQKKGKGGCFWIDLLSCSDDEPNL